MRSSSLEHTRISWTSISSVLNAYVAPSLFLQASSLIPEYTVSTGRSAYLLLFSFISPYFIFAISLLSYVSLKKTIYLSLKCLVYLKFLPLFYTFFYPQPHLQALNFSFWATCSINFLLFSITLATLLINCNCYRALPFPFSIL